MTCIVGIISKVNNQITIGGDSVGACGYDVTVRKDPKVFRIGDFLFGCTTSFRMMQLVRYSFEPPAITAPCVGLSQSSEPEDIFKYMCTSFVNSLRTCLKQGGVLEMKNEVEQGGEFLVSYKDRLFCIAGDFQVSESVEHFASVGCGSSYALGALKALTENTALDGEELAKKALEIASHFSGAVRPPFNFVTTYPVGEKAPA